MATDDETETTALAVGTEDAAPAAEIAPQAVVPDTIECECPSGLAGRVGPLRAEYASILADQKAMRTGKAADQILRVTWVEMTNLGPYRRSTNGGGIDWANVLVCDRIVALLRARIATYGNTEEINLVCPACRKKFIWDLPFDEFIDGNYRELPEASRAKIAAGDNRFEHKLATGQMIAFKLMTGRDQVKVTKSLRENSDEIVTAALAARIVDIEGVDKKQIEKWIDAQTMGLVQEMIDVFDEHDGGVDTEIDVYCPACAHEWSLDLPLDLSRMFTPKRSGRRRRKSRRKSIR